MRRLFVISLVAGIALSGCVVRTRPGAAYRGGFALCDAEGNVELLDAESGAGVPAASQKCR